MLRILLVEDNPADVEMLREALQAAGSPVEIVIAEDGANALEYLSRANATGSTPQCDVVLVDLNLPRKNGFELLEDLRARDELKDLPAVVISGSTDPRDVDRSYRAGANSYISKPSHLDEILAMADEFVAYWSKCVKLPSKRSTVSATSRAGVSGKAVA